MENFYYFMIIAGLVIGFSGWYYNWSGRKVWVMIGSMFFGTIFFGPLFYLGALFALAIYCIPFELRRRRDGRNALF